MDSLPQIVVDLAYILVVASLVTIVFKRLRQPLVLGYIVAGFLAGPNMIYMPSVADVHTIEEWSQIGVIFLMFTLGLEFSFKKIMRMGVKPVICTLCVMFSMISVGSMAGYAFGWSGMDRLFLGGMLAMSSTTIIYKAFDDLGLRTQRFATGVLSTLILEDILGILLMVMLSAVAVSRQVEGVRLITSFLQLVFFLIICLLIGIFLLPLFFRHFKKYINTETLLIISVGLCFFLVVVASKMGYSPAFGAFMMGSILSETMESERIEHNITSLRNLFGAIFFVSVGMLVDPQILLEYWFPIIAITLVVIFGQMVFGSLSFLLSGSTMPDAMRSGFSLVQIGEFAFIIAALGESLEVTSSFLYPVVVAVSIITTFFTPYIMRLANPAYRKLEPFLPAYLREKSRRRKSSRKNTNLTLSHAWNKLLGEVMVQTIAYITLCIALCSFSVSFLSSLFDYLCGEFWGGILCAIFTIILLAPCIRPIIMRKNKNFYARFICSQGHLQHTLFYGLVFSKFFLGAYLIAYVFSVLTDLPLWLSLVLGCALAAFMVTNRMVKYFSIRVERIFTQNFSFKERHSADSLPSYGRPLSGRDIHISTVVIPLHSLWSGHTLSRLHFGRTNQIHVVAIIRGMQRINIPGPNNIIYSGDVLEIAGDETSIAAFRSAMSADVHTNADTIVPSSSLHITHFKLTSTSAFTGHSLIELNMRAKHNCLVIGVEDAQGRLCKTQPSRPFQEGDILWIVGEEADLSLIRMCV